MTEADTVLLPQPSSPLAPQRLSMPARGRDRRVAILLGGAAIVGATATMAVAAQTALPGESLYSVKRGIEAAEVRFAGDDAARGRALLANAETRLTELEALAASDDPSTQQTVPDTLDAFTEESSEGVGSLLTAYAQSGSEADVERAREFTATSLDRLSALEGQVPESARDELLGRSHPDRPRPRGRHRLPGLRRWHHHHPGLPAEERARRPDGRARRRQPDPGGGAGLRPGRHRDHRPPGPPARCAADHPDHAADHDRRRRWPSSRSRRRQAA